MANDYDEEEEYDFYDEDDWPPREGSPGISKTFMSLAIESTFEPQCDWICPQLTEDARQTCILFKQVDEMFCMPAAEIHIIDGSPLCSVSLRFPLEHIPPKLRKAWDLGDSFLITIRLDAVHCITYRSHDHNPRVVAIRDNDDTPSVFPIGSALSNAAMNNISSVFHITSCDSDRNNFIMELYKQLELRLRRITEFCISCGNPLPSGGSLPSVCDRTLCIYQCIELHLFDNLVTPRISSEVLDLLLLALHSANRSSRRTVVLNPEPIVPNIDAFKDEVLKLGGDAILCLDAKELLRALDNVSPCPKVVLESISHFKNFRNKNPAIFGVFQWLSISHKAYLERLPTEKTLKFLQTDIQYLFVSDTPTKQLEFESLVNENNGKTRFLFHGSSIDNWHSIIRGGLKNMSGTNNQLNGSAFGSGIYLSPHLATSLGYSQSGGRILRDCCRGNKCCLASNDSIHIVALVEVVDHTQAYTTVNEDRGVIVVNNEKWCSLRMLLLYPSTTQKPFQLGYFGERNMCNLNKISTENRCKISQFVELFKSTDVVSRSDMN